MNEGTLALMIPIFSVIGGIAIVIVAIVTDYRKKTQMIEKGMEIPMKKPTPYGGIKFGALIIGAAIGLTFGSKLSPHGWLRKNRPPKAKTTFCRIW